MENYRAVATTEAYHLCLPVPEIIERAKIIEFHNNTIEYTLLNALRDSVATEDDKKIYDNFTERFSIYKASWKKWIDNEYAISIETFNADWTRWENSDNKEVDLNTAMLRDNALIKSPSPVLRNLQNRCFPGIDLISPVSQDGKKIYPSEEFRENILKNLGVIPEDKVINDWDSFKKASGNENIIRPSFDKYPNRIENLKGNLDGLYFEVEQKEGGTIIIFLNQNTLKKLIE